MSQLAEENKAIVRRLHEALNEGNLAALDEHPGLGEFKSMYGRLLVAFPDTRNTIERLVAEDDWVAYHLAVRGTHQGEWLGCAPTGRQVAWEVDGMYQLAGGKIVGGYGQANLGDRLQQGAAQPAATA
jgi:predicted ester cyclase